MTSASRVYVTSNPYAQVRAIADVSGNPHGPGRNQLLVRYEDVVPAVLEIDLPRDCTALRLVASNGETMDFAIPAED